MTILQPPKIIRLTGPTIFLAGPIQGAPDWQSDAITILQELVPGVHITNPRREYLDGEFNYEAQVDWETHYLNRAGQDGVVLFWLAKEQTHNCERAYAQTSRFELAEWKLRFEYEDIKLAVGIERGFSNERYIRRRFSQDCPSVWIESELADVCAGAVRLLERDS
jgi:hypothetical protein